MTNLAKLPLRISKGVVNVVVETPKNSPVKLDYDQKLKVFLYAHPLTLGLVFPYDWGFFPSTQAADGDPLDTMILHESATYPGVVIACRPIGVVRLTEKKKGKARIRNDRLLCVPAAAGRYSDARDAPKTLRKELERFFALAAALEDKQVDIGGWDGPHRALELIARAH
jgi:inorganic pyrophosphatase